MAVFDDVLSPSARPASVFPDAPAHYAFRARLGEGGHGEVYEAWDARLQRGVAIKRVKQDAIAAGADLMHEARMAASLHHPAFVKVHAIEEVGASQFIVMELVPGRTLKQVLADGKPDLATAFDWIRQVAEAMQDAHASGLVHGDLKPSNLMIEPSGKVRILDFGLALRQDMLETTTVTQSAPQGTIAYMAPERLLGALPDARGDVYSLGVILYELVVGSRPFSALNGLALAAAQVQSTSDSWNYPDHLDTPSIALIRSMTARLPEHRLPAMREVSARLQQAAQADDGQGVALKRPDAEQAQPGRKLKRGAWIAGSALAVALLAAAAWFQAAPDFGALHAALAPYSEAGEMDAGLAALKLYDRPGELESAEGHFNRILARSPNNAAAIAGMSLVQNLRYTSDNKDEVWLQKAEAGAQLALTLNDQLALSQIAEGALRDRKGEFKLAVAAYDRALNLDPNNYFAWHGKVESLRNAQQYPQALAAIAEAMRRFPKESIFYGELGVLKFEQGDYQAAEGAFRQSIAMQPDAVFPYASLNVILVHQKRFDEALRVLQQGLQIRPSAALYSSLGNALFLRGDYVGAAAAFESAVSPAHGSPGAYLNWANLGDTLLWLPGREQQARHAYDKARTLLEPQLKRAPDNPVLVSRMGLYAARAGAPADALRLMHHAIDLSPQDAAVRFRAAVAFELLGKRADALAAIAMAKKLGYPLTVIDADPDLTALRRDPGYRND
jgi:serine/threonine-protein kinase